MRFQPTIRFFKAHLPIYFFALLALAAFGEAVLGGAPLNAQCTPVPTGLVSWWPGEGTADDVASGNHGVFSNGFYTTGRVGQAFDFNGFNTRITVPDDPSLDVELGDFSILFWIRTSALGDQAPFDKRQNVPNQGYHGYFPNGQPGIQIASNGAGNNFVSTTSISSGTWRHVAFTIDRDSPTGLRIYIDGAVSDTFDPTPFPGSLASTEVLVFGSRTPSQNGNGYFPSTLDEIAFFDRALTAQEVADIFNAGGDGMCAPAPEPAGCDAVTVPEFNDYSLLYTLNIPIDADYEGGTPAYAVDNSATIGAFDRVAYCLELDDGSTDWVWVSMDAFTAVPEQTGVPVNANGAVFEQTVGQMNIFSNVAGLTTGSGITTGNLEFWDSCYGVGADSGLPGASSSAYDFDDTRNLDSLCFGSMQVHNFGAGQTVFAYNSWDTPSVDDVGIGNQGIGAPDWTLAQNANLFTRRDLHVYVRTVATTPPLLSAALAPSSVFLGESSRLTLTIDNSANTVPVGNLDLIDNLPAGMVLATPANMMSDCGGSVVAPDGGSTLSLTGGNLAASASCTLGVDVTATALGTLLNVTGDLTSDFGNSGNASAELTVGVPVSLSIAEEIPAFTGGTVDVPIELTVGISDLASMTFSLDFDEACLTFDPADVAPADGLPDAINLGVGPGFTAVVLTDLGDTDGELDFALFADNPATTGFTSGTLATVTFGVTCSAGPVATVTAPIAFSADPDPSFGDASAQNVLGVSDGGSVRVFDGIRGDCNADGSVSAPDATAVRLETFDGDGTLWSGTLDVVPYLGSPVGCDANADNLVDSGDLSCAAQQIFGGSCAAPLQALDGPLLGMPGEISVNGDEAVVRLRFDAAGHAINSLIVSLDYDQEQLVFEDVPGAVRFLGTPVTVRSMIFDPTDPDGELDLVLADLTTTQILASGAVLEIDLRVLDPSADTLKGAVLFSNEPPASFGDVAGRSVSGTAVLEGPGPLFVDGFESGDTGAWSP